VLLAVGGAAGAQDLAPQLSGWLDSSWVVTDAAGGQSSGLVTGWTQVDGGTKDVKGTVRFDVADVSDQAPTAELSRAWMKFRFPGVRFTTGLGRIGWGPGRVLVPGDLLFDSVGTELNFESDELRTAGAWLGDAWVSLGDEAFAEAAVVQSLVAARVSAAPGGVTLEAASAWDAAANTAKAALSTQFHLGVDWYATVREDLPAEASALSPPAPSTTSAGAGAFGLWTLEAFTLTSRHELWFSDPGPAVQAKTYDDLIASFGNWSVVGRVLTNAFPVVLTPLAELHWGPLQNLGLYLVASFENPAALQLGATAKW
jgi:hypothetical protein